MQNKQDDFIDRDIDFDLEITRSILFSQGKAPNRCEWSGQDIKIDFDPFNAYATVNEISGLKVYPYFPLGSLVKFRSQITKLIRNQYFENLMMLLVGANVIVL